MPKLSITVAWNETTAFVKREAGLVFPIALGLMAIPMVFLQLIAPTAAPGQQPEAGPWMLLLLPLVFLSLIGTIAISALAIGRESVVGDALKLGARRFLPLLGAMLLMALCFMPAFLLLALVLATSPAIGALLALVAIVAGIILWVRLMLMTPVAAAETGGPLSIVKRSFQLTRGHTAKLIGFVILIFILAGVAIFALISVGGIMIVLLAGKPEPGSVAFLLVLLLGGLLNTVFLVYFTTLVARIYAQLADQPASGI